MTLSIAESRLSSAYTLLGLKVLNFLALRQTDYLGPGSTEQFISSEQSEHRTAHFERTVRTLNSPNTKNFEKSRTGQTVRTPSVRTLVDPALGRKTGHINKYQSNYFERSPRS